MKNGAELPRCLVLFFPGSLVPELVEQMFIRRDAPVLEDSRPSTDRHLFRWNQCPDFRTGWPGLRVSHWIGQRHSHSQPVRTGAVPAFFEDRLFAHRKAVLIQPLTIIKAR